MYVILSVDFATRSLDRYTLKLCSFEAKVTSFEIDKLQILKLHACGFVHVNHVASFFFILCSLKRVLL
jgi:hypothetical protein